MPSFIAGCRLSLLGAVLVIGFCNELRRSRSGGQPRWIPLCRLRSGIAIASKAWGFACSQSCHPGLTAAVRATKPATGSKRRREIEARCSPSPKNRLSLLSSKLPLVASSLTAASRFTELISDGDHTPVRRSGLMSQLKSDVEGEAEIWSTEYLPRVGARG
ncbi:hypothetical protein DM860_014802 [Cuscuta australis]|uniref:Secreted protein n=1 Tax=Cuscuta australis TaxID=267555 RepID=A0A328D0K2_9ASTE|nr:hypothetical protein DM860_014802 [Cuscuta australis]